VNYKNKNNRTQKKYKTQQPPFSPTYVCASSITNHYSRLHTNITGPRGFCRSRFFEFKIFFPELIFTLLCSFRVAPRTTVSNDCAASRPLYKASHEDVLINAVSSHGKSMQRVEFEDLRRFRPATSCSRWDGRRASVMLSVELVVIAWFSVLTS
jgi:hypothetical protein